LLIDNTNGIQFRDSEVQLQGCVVARNHWGVRTVYSDVTIRDCLIEDNLDNGINIRDGKLTLEQNRIVGNRRGIYLQRSRGRVFGNQVVDNNEHGIFLEDSKVEVVDNRLAGNGRAGVRWLNSTGRLARNTITDNGVYALINDGTEPLDARFNWWGTADAATIDHSVRDGRNRPGLGLVDYRFALTQPMILPLPEIQGN
jgi:parallel beta-helix repeat protein